MRNRFAAEFYVSSEWIACRKAYAESVGWLCERCAANGYTTPGEEVHHKIRLTKDNLHDPAIALSWDNLEMLCKDCHLKEHGKRRMRTDPGGHVTL